MFHQTAKAFIELINCPPGECTLGSNDDHANEKPKHQIKLTYAFQIAKTPVTQAQWKKLMPSHPSHFQGDQHPVDSVTWIDCIEFCNRASQHEGLEICYEISTASNQVIWHRSANGYRLPTEAEWAYAAYAQEDVLYAGQEPLKNIAWFGENEFLDDTPPQTHEVMLKLPNAWGIYDMSGNVWEWCHDQFTLFHQVINQEGSKPIENPVYWTNDLKSNRVLKGGCYWNLARSCRISTRSKDEPSVTHDGRGMRVVRGIIPKI